MIVGFTGTRAGMSDLQLVRVQGLLKMHKPKWVVHGGAVGADLQFHDLANVMGVKAEVWPARDDLPDWVVQSAIEIKPVMLPLDRNHKIVDSCDLLIAAPRIAIEERRSGTWATIRYARKMDKRRIIVWPEGDESGT